ncbi:MAG: phosphotransferase [Myxococcales bacterium]|nr:phosphotransferase [Myxococcales bacterium]
MNEFSGAEASLAIDDAALGAYLAGRLEGLDGPLRSRQFAGGQSNPTYLIEAGERRWVLRKKPPGQLLPKAHMVDREHRIFSALADTDVPVPRTYLLCEDPSIIGTEFFVMEYVQGRIFWDPTLPECSVDERRSLYDEMNRVLSALHQVDYAARGLSGYGRPGNYFGRQIARWSRQYEAARTGDLPSMDALMKWLPENIPDDDQSCIVHGDFRLDNMIFHPEEPRVLAVLDWELSTLGHPLADLAYNCMPYHLPSREAPALSTVAGTAAGEESGIPTEEQYVARYCERVGRSSIPAWRFYLVFSIFRYASIVQGVYARGLQGNASSAGDARGMRERAVQAADTAWSLVS